MPQFPLSMSSDRTAGLRPTPLRTIRRLESTPTTLLLWSMPGKSNAHQEQEEDVALPFLPLSFVWSPSDRHFLPLGYRVSGDIW